VSENATEPSTPASDVPKHTAVSLAVAIGLAVAASWAMMAFPSASREAAFMAGIFVLAAVLWVTEALPIFATALIVVGLQILLLTNPGGWAGLGFESGASPSYRHLVNLAADPVLLLFFGGFVLARAATNEGVDRAMCALLLRPFGMQPRRVLLGLILITMLFSMWMSNTATTALMMALVTPMLAAMPPKEPFRKAIALAVPFAANIGGLGTPIASPPNAIAMSYLQKEGHSIAFLDWMLVAAPLMTGLGLFTWLTLAKCYSPATAGLRLEHASARLTRRGWFVVAVFVVTVALWMTDRWHGLPAAVVALLPAVALTATGVFTREDLGRLEWSVLVLIAGGISLGAGMQLTGLDRLVVGWLPSSGENPLLLLTTLVLATLVLGTFMSNTAAANLLLPVGLSSASLAGGLPPVQAALSIALAASLSMALPISTPPNAIAYARGEFTTRDMARVGLLVGVVGALWIILGSGFVMRWWGVLK
jgi:sodium-dependent dicarboxylate transporter 2/3/5